MAPPPHPNMSREVSSLKVFLKVSSMSGETRSPGWAFRILSMRRPIPSIFSTAPRADTTIVMG